MKHLDNPALTFFEPTRSGAKSGTNLFIDFLHVQALQSATQVSKRTFVCSILPIEVVLLGIQETLSAMPRVSRLDHDAGLGDC